MMQASDASKSFHQGSGNNSKLKWLNSFNGDSVPILLLLLISLLVWVPRIRGSLDLRWDASVYYVLGTSLARGDGYRLLNEPGNIEAVQYPPLFPALIALHQRVLGTSDPVAVTAALKLVWVLLFSGVVVSTYLFVKRHTTWGWGFLSAISVALNFNLHLHFNQCTAELPYAAATMFFLVVYRDNGGRIREVLLAFGAMAAFFIRTAGVVLLIAWIIDGLIRKQFRRAVIRFAISATCLVAWQGYIGLVESSASYKNPPYAYQRSDYLFYNVSYSRNASYVDPYRPELGKASFEGLLRRFVSAAKTLPARLGETMTSYRGMWELQTKSLERLGIKLSFNPLLSILFWIVGLLILLGLCSLLIKREWIVPLYFAGTALLVCAAPWPGQHVRYFSPLLPVLLLGFVVGIRSLSLIRRVDRSVAPWLSAGIMILVLAHQAVAYYQAHRYMLVSSSVRDSAGRWDRTGKLGYEQDLIAMDHAIAWLTNNVPQGAVVAGAMPQWIYLQTGLKAVMPPLEADPIAATRLLDSVPVTYLLCEKAGFFSWPYVEALVRASPDKWQLIYAPNDNLVLIYRRTAIR